MAYHIKTIKNIYFAAKEKEYGKVCNGAGCRDNKQQMYFI